MKYHLQFSLVLLCAAFLAGCVSTGTGGRNAVPEALVASATPSGYSKVRFWGDDASSITSEDTNLIVAQRLAAAKSDPSLIKGRINFLALSGGGSNGAFGAGILIGWGSRASGRASTSSRGSARVR